MEYIYAALLLHKLGQEVNEDNLRRVIQATGASVDDSKVKVLVASLKGINISEKLANASIATGPVQSSSPSSAPKEEKKEEPRAEAAEGLASLFG